MWCIGVLRDEYRRRMYALLELHARPMSRAEPVICIDEKSLQLIGDSRTRELAQYGRDRNWHPESPVLGSTHPRSPRPANRSRCNWKQARNAERRTIEWSFRPLMCFIPGRRIVWPSDTRGRSRMPKLGTYGSVRGVPGNRHPYRDRGQGALWRLKILFPIPRFTRLKLANRHRCGPP